MKKLKISIAVISFLFGCESLNAQWTSVGSNIYNINTGNVGIGNNNPAYKLDISGRSRFRAGGGTAGFWLMNSVNTVDRAFIGMADDNLVGFWGQGGAAWSLLMNVNNGNVGIGTTNPTQKLTIGKGNVFLPSASAGNEGNLYFGGVTDVSQIGMRLFGGAINGGALNGGVIDVRTKTLTEGLIFRVDNTYGGTERMRICANGNVGIGTDLSSNVNNYKLSVNGSIRAKEVIVETGWADFVFEKDYQLKSLDEVENFIKLYKHLPEVPSAKEVEENGVTLGKMNAVLLQKIEELTLYMIALKKQNDVLTEKITTLVHE